MGWSLLGPMWPVFLILASRVSVCIAANPRVTTLQRGPTSLQPDPHGQPIIPASVVPQLGTTDAHAIQPKSEISGGLQVYYQVPPTRNSTSLPPGLFVLFHACGHTGFDWWSLPEEKAMTSVLLNRGFAAVAFTAQPATGLCWHPNNDSPLVANSMNLFIKMHGLQGVPIYGLGTSSGGVVLADLVSRFKIGFAGVYFCVSPGGALAPGTPGAPQNNWGPGTFATKTFPPSFFVYMENDPIAPRNAVLVAKAALKEAGVPVQTREVKPKPVYELAHRTAELGLTQDVTARLMQTFKDWGFVQKKRDRFLQPGREPTEEEYLTYGYVDTLILKISQDPAWMPTVLPVLGKVSEELHVLEARHGVISDYFSEGLDFLIHSSKLPPIRGKSKPNA